jgi:hypothetical protein
MTADRDALAALLHEHYGAACCISDQGWHEWPDCQAKKQWEGNAEAIAAGVTLRPADAAPGLRKALAGIVMANHPGYLSTERVEGPCLCMAHEDARAALVATASEGERPRDAARDKAIAFGIHDAADIAREMGATEVADALRAEALRRYAELPPLVAVTSPTPEAAGEGAGR